MAPRRGRDRGFTLIELLVVMAIIALLAATALPVYKNALARARLLALAADLTELHEAFTKYNADFGHFPQDNGARRLDTATLNPLASGGYFRGVQGLNRKLVNDRIWFYWAPDWRGPNSDYLLLARSKEDPSAWIYVMHYEFPGAFSYDGIYVLEDGVLTRWDGRL